MILGTQRADREQEAPRALLREWRANHKATQAVAVGLVSTAISVLLMPFDYILFGDNYLVYFPFRIGLACFFAFVALSASASSRASTPAPLADSAMLASFPVVWELCYFYFLWEAHSRGDIDSAKIVLIGTIMVVIFTTLFIYQFWEEQYLFQGSSILLLTIWAVSGPPFAVDLVLLVIAHLCTGLFCYLFRRPFETSFIEKNLSLRRLMPIDMARQLSVARSTDELISQFKPKYTFTVCLIADWRGSQELASNRVAEDIVHYYERYYGLIGDHLRTAHPNGGYYMEWIADELIVLFYATEEGERRATSDQAVASAVDFLGSYVGPLRIKIREALDFDLRFDVGISCGTGMLGLLGPMGGKKTTLIGDVAGLAKRYEEEAKTIRASHAPAQEQPFVVMGSSFYERASSSLSRLTGEIEEADAQAKNIRGDKVYVWDTSKGSINDIAS